MSAGYAVLLILFSLGSLAYGIVIGKSIGYCDRILEEMHETLDRMKADAPQQPMSEESGERT